MARIWDRFLTEQDKEILAISGERKPTGIGERPAMLLVDNYERAYGPDIPVVDAMKVRAGYTGEIAWRSVPPQRELLELFRSFGLPVIHVTMLSEGGLPEWSWCVTHPEERGVLRPPLGAPKPEVARFIDQLAPIENEYVIKKIAQSAFWGTPLIGLLRFLEVDTLIITGEATSGCIRATVVDAVAHRFRVTLPEECVFERFEASHAINMFNMHNKLADVVPTAEVVTQLRKAHPAEK